MSTNNFSIVNLHSYLRKEKMLMTFPYFKFSFSELNCNNSKNIWLPKKSIWKSIQLLILSKMKSNPSKTLNKRTFLLFFNRSHFFEVKINYWLDLSEIFSTHFWTCFIKQKFLSKLVNKNAKFPILLWLKSQELWWYTFQNIRTIDIKIDSLWITKL